MTKRSLDRPGDIGSSPPADLMTDGLTNQDLHPVLWHVQVENDRAARRALYAARAQLG